MKIFRLGTTKAAEDSHPWEKRIKQDGEFPGCSKEKEQRQILASPWIEETECEVWETG